MGINLVPRVSTPFPPGNEVGWMSAILHFDSFAWFSLQSQSLNNRSEGLRKIYSEVHSFYSFAFQALSSTRLEIFGAQSGTKVFVLLSW